MGHIRLGRLPRTRRWTDVVAELSNRSASAASIGSKTLLAATSSLRRASDEPGTYGPLATLSRLVVAARSDSSFQKHLTQLGVPQQDRSDGIRLLAAIERGSAGEQGKGPRTVLSDIALRAQKEVLLVRVRSASDSLWGVGPEEVRLALKQCSTEKGYSELARDWFSRFLGRTLQYFVDRELSNHVGPTSAATTTGAALSLERELVAFASERTRVLAEFAPGWLSKTVWKAGGISDASAQGFFSYAIKKLLDDIKREAGE